MSRTPRTRHPLRWIKRLQLLFAVGLVIVLAVIVGYFLTHLKRPGGLQSSEEGFAPQKIEVQESATHLEFDRGLSRMDIKFNKRYLGSDGLYHLEGGVEVIDHGKKGGREIRIRSDQAVSDKDQTLVRFAGHVSIISKGLTLQADSFTYDKSRDLIFNETGVTMSSERFTGSARSYAYSLRDETVVMEGEVDFSIRPQIGDSQFLTIQGRRMVFNYPQRRAHIEGDVDLRHGRSRGTAEAVEIQLFEGKDIIHLLWLMGRARIVLREAPKPAKGRVRAPVPKKDPAAAGPPSYESLFLFESADQDITSDQILIASFDNVRRIRGVRARGGASFVLTSAEGQTTRIEGDAVNFAFQPARGLEAIDVRGPGRVRAASKDVPAGRSIEGRFILYDGFNRVLKTGGSEANPARSVSEGRDVRAENMVIFFQSNSFDAWGSVMAVLEDQPGAPSSGAFFTPGRPVFARARLFRFFQDKQELALTDNVRLWQDKQVLLGPEIVINKETQAMRGTGGVKTQFSQAPKAGGPDDRVEVGGDRMDYDPKTRVVVFAGNGYLRTKDMDIKAEAVSIVPEASGGRPRLIHARGKVILTQKTREAHSEAADYDVGQETVVLTGHPVVVDKQKGTFRGDKLTFHLADGNIRVDNGDQQRSDVVIKS